jgi:hypothetical protein
MGEGTWLIDLAPEWLRGNGEATERPGEPGDREVCLCFGSLVRSARLFLPVRMGGVSLFQLGIPLAPGRARTNWSGYIRVQPDDPR